MDNQADNGTNQGPGNTAGSGFNVDKEAVLAFIKPAAERATAILTKPQEAWAAIKAEPTTINDIITRYVMILAAIPAICGFIGSLFLGTRFFSSLVAHILMYGITIAGVYLAAFVFNKLAPKFDGMIDMTEAIKLAAFSSTASYVAGVFSLVPPLAWIGGLVSLYSLYLLYTGIPVMSTVPQPRRLAYFGVSLLTMIVIYAIIALIIGALLLPAVVIIPPGTPPPTGM
jgi:hypothetical protein